jgi:integrase
MPIKRRAEATWIESRSRWQINVQRDGKRKTFTSSTPGRKGKHEAEGKADDWLEAGQPDDIRFDRAWAQYLDHLAKTTGTQNYKDADSIGRTWLLASLGQKKLSRIRLDDLQEIISSAGEKGRSKRTCKNIKDKINAFARYAADQRWEFSADPTKIKLPTQAQTAKRTIIQPEQLRTLFAEDTITRKGTPFHAYYIYAFRLMVSIGCRSGELCGLRNEDCDGEYITIRRSINKLREITPGKTENAQRRIYLPEHAKEILAKQKAMLESLGIKSHYLFPQEDGSPSFPNHIWNHWRTYIAQHGIDCSIHELRHTFVSMMTTNLPAYMLKSVVGHSENFDTDGVYSHELQGDKKRAAKIIDEVLSKHLGTH